MEKYYSDGTEPDILPHFGVCQGVGCQQGRKPCPHPEDCMLEEDRRLGCVVVVALGAALWLLIFLAAWALW